MVPPIILWMCCLNIRHFIQMIPLWGFPSGCLLYTSSCWKRYLLHSHNSCCAIAHHLLCACITAAVSYTHLFLYYRTKLGRHHRTRWATQQVGRDLSLIHIFHRTTTELRSHISCYACAQQVMCNRTTAVVRLQKVSLPATCLLYTSGCASAHHAWLNSFWAKFWARKSSTSKDNFKVPLNILRRIVLKYHLRYF